MEKILRLSMGAMSAPISKQLTEQGFKFDKKKVGAYEQQADAITRLHINGILAPSESNKCRDRLHKKIIKHLSDSN